jgi:hypothetical protein
VAFDAVCVIKKVHHLFNDTRLSYVIEPRKGQYIAPTIVSTEINTAATSNEPIPGQVASYITDCFASHQVKMFSTEPDSVKLPRCLSGKEHSTYSLDSFYSLQVDMPNSIGDTLSSGNLPSTTMPAAHGIIGNRRTQAEQEEANETANSNSHQIGVHHSNNSFNNEINDYSNSTFRAWEFMSWKTSSSGSLPSPGTPQSPETRNSRLSIQKPREPEKWKMLFTKKGSVNVGTSPSSGSSNNVLSIQDLTMYSVPTTPSVDTEDISVLSQAEPVPCELDALISSYSYDDIGNLSAKAELLQVQPELQPSRIVPSPPLSPPVKAKKKRWGLVSNKIVAVTAFHRMGLGVGKIEGIAIDSNDELHVTKVKEEGCNDI